MNNKILTILAFTIIMSLGANNASGQISFKEIKKQANKVQSKAYKHPQKDIDEEIDKAFNRIEKKYNKDERKEGKKDRKDSSAEDAGNHEKALNDMMSKMGMSSTPVTLEDEYDFNSSVTMNFKTYSKDGKEKNNGNMISYYSPDGKSIAYEFLDGNIKNTKNDETGMFILDFTNRATIILNNNSDEKTGIAYGMGDMLSDEDMKEAMVEDQEHKKHKKKELKEKNPYLKKTGREKDILGYTCEEYTLENDEVSSSFWITKDVSWNNRDLMLNLFSGAEYSYASPNGFLMESTTFNKKTGEKSVYTVTEINKNIDKAFDLTQYQISNIGTVNMQDPEE